MKVTNEKMENSQAFLTIEMESDEVEEALKKSYHHLVGRVDIPGFRKGKAPRAILERYVGRERLLQDALDELVPEAYEKAIKEQGIEAIAQPQIEIVQTEPVLFKATVPLEPTVKLGDYHSIRLTPEIAKVEEEDVDAAIEQLRHQHATWEPVERPVDFSDLLVLEIESSVDGEPFISQKEAQYQVLHGSSFPVPGFAEQLSGMKLGEKKEFSLQLPSDYARSELAGKEAQFKVEVIEVKQERLPELNDEFAKTVNPDFETLTSLRERVSTNLRLNAEEKARTDYEGQLVEAVTEITQVEFPPVLVEMEITQLLKEQVRRWQMADKDLDEYLRSINKTEEELREELRSLATKRVTQSLVLGKIAEEEKIEVNSSEVDAEIENMTKGADNADDREELQKFLNTPQSRGSIERLLLTRKTVERLVEVAKGSGEE